MDSCIVCDQTVRPRQEALLCDRCELWQHRTCQTGISQLDYREAVRSGKSIDSRCVECEGPIMNSTPLIFTDDEQVRKSENIARAANRRRRRLRPKDPQDLEFELATDHMPAEFLRADLRVRSRRHLVFATDQ